MQKYWNGKGEPKLGDIYLDEYDHLCAFIAPLMIASDDVLFIGKMLDMSELGEHKLPALSFSRLERMKPVPDCNRESRTLEQLEQETKALISEMFQCAVPFNDIDVIRRSVKKEETYRETEHIEALLMNRVFDQCGDLLFVECAQQAAREEAQCNITQFN